MANLVSVIVAKDGMAQITRVPSHLHFCILTFGGIFRNSYNLPAFLQAPHILELAQNLGIKVFIQGQARKRLLLDALDSDEQRQIFRRLKNITVIAE